jgi:peroxiredoxin
MKSVLQTVGVVVLVVAAAAAYLTMSGRKGYALRAGGTAPDFRLTSLAGKEDDLASHRGKIVVLSFWATWCPPCIAEMPSLERLQQTLGPEGLVVLAVSADEDRSDLERFISARRLTLPVLWDAGGRVATDRYRTTGYPETFVIDRSGVVLQHIVGPAEWDTKEAIAYFRSLLAGTTTARWP